MQQSFITGYSRKNNAYALDLNKRQVLFLHPLLAFFAERFKTAGSIPPQLPAATEASLRNTWCSGEIAYYYQKFLLLKESGYFSASAQGADFSQTVDPEQIEQGLANNRRVVLEVTDRCNLQCAYCGYGELYWDHDIRENKNLNPATAKTLLHFLQGYWNSAANVSDMEDIYLSFYGGEPLLNFSLIREMMHYCQALPLKKNRIRFMMTTNGVLLKQYLEELVAGDFYLSVSLDGNQEHNSYRTFSRGASSHALVADNLKLCRRKYPGFFRDRVSINAVLHNRNSVAAVVEYFKSEFDKVPRILGLNPAGIRQERREEFLRTYQNLHESVAAASNCRELESELFSQLPHTQGLGIFLRESCDFCHQDYMQAACEPSVQKRFPTATCLPFAHKVFLTVNGKLLPCEKIGFQYGLGRVTKEKVQLDFRAIAQKYNDWLAKFSRQCAGCYNQKTCGKCMFFTDLEDKQLKCDEWMNAGEYSRAFSFFINYLEENPQVYGRVLPGGKDAANA
ncbi:radical SAM peptide maturase [candidate division FCPU426 bacterium]|nr:radical SAM peptide maturase [candidate division FCPU426 bacterium]